MSMSPQDWQELARVYRAGAAAARAYGMGETSAVMSNVLEAMGSRAMQAALDRVNDLESRQPVPALTPASFPVMAYVYSAHGSLVGSGLVYSAEQWAGLVRSQPPGRVTTTAP